MRYLFKMGVSYLLLVLVETYIFTFFRTCRHSGMRNRKISVLIKSTLPI